MPDKSDFPGSGRTDRKTDRGSGKIDAADESRENHTRETGSQPETRQTPRDLEQAGKDELEPSGSDDDSEPKADSGKFDSVKRKLSGGASRVSGGLKSAYRKPVSYVSSWRSGSGNPGSSGNPGGGNPGDDSGFSRREYLFGVGTGVLGTGAAAVVADAAEGEIGDGRYAWFDDDEMMLGANETATPQTTSEPGSNEPNEVAGPEGAPDDPAALEDPVGPEDSSTPEDTPQTPERSYRGEVDGTGYDMESVPGAASVDGVSDDARGFVVEDDLLASYDPAGWGEIESDDSFEELGAGTEWYVTEDAVIGVDRSNRVIWSFSEDEFNYDADGLYQDIAQEAN